ncbi:E set domain-containing protein [Metschnikowia bicuspidata var. bicuspidata NRRL YB-4993]|uniref:E set domain-containing protein n=1 Tax=Metschnikowia bicuspidata var. bicuspidata NRRL YB-4993 TaxID=869754 RepID=A0A1A0HJT1_9ASCO|nr:E set domain-containing protein [Metschnikowia bicuspidata var. bicuspidata NRRL YB-4993]OBA24256.1 E set domain-containing protein [Metschnikowia bicuspidata var. bicuspidata NRRL YB-4993]
MSNEELTPEQVEGYVVSEKKTIEEYTKLDAEDESLAKWKASLGLSASANAYPVAPGDKRTVVIVEMALVFPELDDLETVLIPMEDANGATIKKDIAFTIKEKTVYELRVKFRVQHEIITGLKYLHSVKKGLVRVDKVDEPLGSYAPNTTEKPYYEKSFGAVEAPSGMFARGSYSAITKFVDDDKTVHLEFPWSFQITK